MKHRVSSLTFLLVIALLFGATVASQTPSQSSDKPLYQPDGTEATVIGSIGIKGPVPRRIRLDMTADPVCVELNDKAETEDVLTNEDRLMNVFVYVKGESLAEHSFPPSDSVAILERRNCSFYPHVMGIRVGQKLTILNHDPTHHNTHPVPRLNQEWNQTQPPLGQPIVKSFPREEVLIPFKCNQHPWERAFVAVLNHSFFAVSDGFGNYEIRGLPAGTYTLLAWHERLGEQQIEISVARNETRRADFDFQTNKKP